MRHRLLVGVVVGLALIAGDGGHGDGLFAAPPGGAQPASTSKDPYPSATPQAVVDVTERIFPAVVRLDVAQEIYSEGKRTLRRGHRLGRDHR